MLQLGDLSAPGNWELQAKIVSPEDFNTDVGNFRAYENLLGVIMWKMT